MGKDWKHSEDETFWPGIRSGSFEKDLQLSSVQGSDAEAQAGRAGGGHQ